ncbi:hypothetical protein UPYG_G00333090 [Umbra pygmaea]|uniref:Granulins domain-containing protein n=1 Tax=Umbra pygmaea TaxID=75934 RepID=A0ABD0WBT7_UMBPY
MAMMWLIATLVLFVAGFASCYITCRDGKVCPDVSTCCLTEQGYGCCPVPNAVCCSDKAHCCPSGFQCNTLTEMCQKETHPWNSIPMLKKVAAEVPSSPFFPPLESQSSPVQSNEVETSKVGKVQCDNVWSCPDGTTCCRHPYGVWWCCPFNLGTCCADGIHCCAYGFYCDSTSTKCLKRDNLRYPFVPRQAPSRVKATKVSEPESKVQDEEVPWTGLLQSTDDAPQAGVIQCDAKFYCPAGNTCCKGPTGQWGCCPYPLGQCCADGKHCCEFGYTCDAKSSKCKKCYSQIPSNLKDAAKQY